MNILLQTVQKLEELYENPSDIDLVVGLMAEMPLEGSLIGPTATCLIRMFFVSIFIISFIDLLSLTKDTDIREKFQ